MIEYFRQSARKFVTGPIALSCLFGGIFQVSFLLFPESNPSEDLKLAMKVCICAPLLAGLLGQLWYLHATKFSIFGNVLIGLHVMMIIVSLMAQENPTVSLLSLNAGVFVVLFLSLMFQDWKHYQEHPLRKR